MGLVGYLRLGGSLLMRAQLFTSANPVPPCAAVWAVQSTSVPYVANQGAGTCALVIWLSADTVEVGVELLQYIPHHTPGTVVRLSFVHELKMY